MPVAHPQTDLAQTDPVQSAQNFTFAIKSLRFDEEYRPTDGTRITTNFANLARGENRQENLRNTLRMIDNRFNALAHWDNSEGERYSIELDIISVEMMVDPQSREHGFPIIEILKTTIVDHTSGRRIDGTVGNNFSSYVRDYDFSILLPEHNRTGDGFALPDDFGDLHGKLFRRFLASQAYRDHFTKMPVICLSVSSSRTYHRTGHHHPILGIEYRQDAFSSTDAYFGKMGLRVRYFMPQGSVAPLAFYFTGDLLGDYTDLELIGTIAAMETFQKIYRPEIYNANAQAGHCYRPNLQHRDYSTTQITYNREERSRLAIEQGRFAQEHFIQPYGALLQQWSATVAL